jgi:hypothetical protein
MKHAGKAALDQLEDLLAQIRQGAGWKEKSRGVFYCKSRAVLHFHEDPTGLFADLRSGETWVRLPVNAAAERRALLAKVRAALPTP